MDASADAPPQTVDGITVTPSPSIRQGQTGILITINKAAGGLSNPGSFSFGGLPVQAQSTSTDTMLVLRVSMVPHAATLGTRTLTFVASGGSVTAMDLVNVTAITASPTGDDKANSGSAMSPYRTVTQAMSVADVGDTVHLTDGTYSYSVQNGETFGFIVPQNLTVTGDSTAGTKIDNGGGSTSTDGFDATTGLSLSNLTVQHFRYGIYLNKASTTITLTNAVVSGNGNQAIYVDSPATGSTLNLTGASTVVDAITTTAINVYGPMTTVNVTGGATVSSGQYGVFLNGPCTGCKINVNNGSIKEDGTSNYQAIYDSVNTTSGAGSTVTLMNATLTGGIYIGDPAATTTISGSTISIAQGNYGIQFAGATLTMTNTMVTLAMQNYAPIYLSAAGSTMSLTGCTLSGGSYGVQQSGAGTSAVLRSTTISGESSYGYYLTAGNLDLGNMTQTGDNTLSAPTGGYCLVIQRAQGASGGNAVTSSTTSYNSNVPSPTSSVDGTQTSTVSVPPRYSVSAGNQLTFFCPPGVSC
jgi:hypothetical protein